MCLAALILAALALLLRHHAVGVPGVDDPEAIPDVSPSGRRAPSAPRAEAPAADLPVASLHVWLRDLHVSRFTNSVPPVPFGSLWPGADDARWDIGRLDGLETPGGIVALSQGGYGYDMDGEGGRQVLASAAREGFLGPEADLASPEAALAALYVEWIHAEASWRDAFQTFVAANVEAGETWESISPAARRALLHRDDFPADAVGPLQHLARDVLSTYPDHPVADHARLALVRAEMPHMEGATWRSDVIATVVDEMTDPRVREQAAMELTKAGSFFRTVTPDLLDVMASIATESPQNALRIETWSLNRAVSLGDWERARAWSERLRATLDDRCGEEAHHSLQCEERRYELRDATARLVALGLTHPTTWQDALTAAAWRCHLEVGPHQGTSRGSATWTGAAWSFEGWTRETPTTACLGAVTSTAVVPDAPVVVRLTLEGSR
ncbi:MAG: hypothetical protein R3F59_18540 [Myxococcota bacterium]